MGMCVSQSFIQLCLNEFKDRFLKVTRKKVDASLYGRRIYTQDLPSTIRAVYNHR